LKFKFLLRPIKPKTGLKPISNSQKPVAKKPVLTSLVLTWS